jgi:hypothetical protein
VVAGDDWKLVAVSTTLFLHLPHIPDEGVADDGGVWGSVGSTCCEGKVRWLGVGKDVVELSEGVCPVSAVVIGV